MNKWIGVFLTLLAGGVHAAGCSEFDRSNRDQYSVGKWESMLRGESRMALMAFYRDKREFLQQCPKLSHFSRAHLENAMRAATNLLNQAPPQKK